MPSEGVVRKEAAFRNERRVFVGSEFSDRRETTVVLTYIYVRFLSDLNMYRYDTLSERKGSNYNKGTLGRVCRIFSGYAELIEVSGTGIEVIPNFLKCRVPVLMSYRTY